MLSFSLMFVARFVCSLSFLGVRLEYPQSLECSLHIPLPCCLITAHVLFTLKVISRVRERRNLSGEQRNGSLICFVVLAGSPSLFSFFGIGSAHVSVRFIALALRCRSSGVLHALLVMQTILVFTLPVSWYNDTQ